MESERLRDEKGHFLPSERSYQPLLKFSSMRNWDMTLRSPKTKDFYYYTLNHFLNSEEVQALGVETPDDLLKLSDSEAVNLIVGFSYGYLERGSERMAELVKLALKRFYAANDRELKSAKLRTRKVAKTERSYNRIIPTKDQVYSMVGAATSLRDKAIILLMFQSGLRNGTVRRLSVGRLRGGLKANEIPLKIDINPMIDKQSLKEPYYTFIDVEAVDAIKLYLKFRGGLKSLPDEAPLFASGLDSNKKMSDMVVLRAVKRAVKNAGLDPKRITPHCLRKSFYNMLVGKVDDVEREFMFGHNMGVREHYFAPQWVEKLRNAYSKVDWHRFPSVALTKEEIRTEVIGALLGKISDAELTPMSQKLGITPQQIRNLIRRVRGEPEQERGETEALLEAERRQRKENYREHQMIVEEEDLPNHLSHGWQVTAVLPSGRVVIGREKVLENAY